MRLSNTFFPTNLPAQAAWMQNFKDQFTNYAATLTLSSYVTPVSEDNEDFQSIAQTKLASRNFDRAVSDYLRELTEGNVGDPQPVFPVEGFAAPPNDRPAGMFQRINELRNLILAQPTYTEAMGIAMGIVPEDGGIGSSGVAKPDIDVSAAATGYMFSIVVTGRQAADAWQVMVAPAGTVNWQIVTTATGKSTDVTYSPGGETPAPVQLQVRVQLRRNNADYGEVSDISLVTVNP